MAQRWTILAVLALSGCSLYFTDERAQKEGGATFDAGPGPVDAGPLCGSGGCPTAYAYSVGEGLLRYDLETFGPTPACPEDGGSLPAGVTGMALRPDGGLLLATPAGLYFFDPAHCEGSLAAPVDPDGGPVLRTLAYLADGRLLGVVRDSALVVVNEENWSVSDLGDVHAAIPPTFETALVQLQDLVMGVSYRPGSSSLVEQATLDSLILGSPRNSQLTVLDNSARIQGLASGGDRLWLFYEEGTVVRMVLQGSTLSLEKGNRQAHHWSAATSRRLP